MSVEAPRISSSPLGSPPGSPVTFQSGFQSGFQLGFKLAALVAGPLIALAIVLILPTSAEGDTAGTVLTPAGRATLAVAAWMACWWLTEAIDISATALLPLVVFPLAGILPMSRAATPYADPVIFLFMGGFMMAGSMQRWGLDRRIALIALSATGTTAAGMTAGVMCVTAVLSMWVSNTATAAMMLPIALSVLALAKRARSDRPSTSPAHDMGPAAPVEGGRHTAREPGGSGSDSPDRRLSLCLLLGIAYAASIGGMGTIIGSPPNGIAAAFIEETYGRQVSFLQWMLFAVPLIILLLVATWFLLVHVLFRPPRGPIEGGGALIRAERARLGAMSAGEWVTFAVFMVTATAWICRPWLVEIRIGDVAPLARLSDAGIAMTAALLLLVIPVRLRPVEPVLNWRSAERLPWGVLILFGGGLSLAEAIATNGVAEFLGAQASALGGVSPLLVLLIVVTAIVFLTELTSNTAITAALVPVLAGIAPGLDMDPLLLIVPAALSASGAFMLPVATPPNAIVFASGEVSIREMARAGFFLNLLSIALITLVAWLLIGRVLGGS